MAKGITAGAAYQQLEKTDNQISQGLQYWGGIKANQIEGDKQRAAQKEENEARRAEAEKERVNKDIEKNRFDFTSKDAGYNSLTENYSDFSRQAAQQHSTLWKEYAKARQEGRMTDAYNLEDQMQRIQTSFKEQQGAAEKFKTIYSQYEEMDKEGKLSDYDKGKWKTIRGFVKGDTKNVFLKYNPETNTGEWVSREISPNGVESFSKLSVSDIDNGRVSPIYKNELDGDKGMVANYASLMGTFKKDYYSQNRDHSESGYTAFAESKLKDTLFNDLDENEVKDLSAQMFNITSGLDNPQQLLQAKKQVVDELYKRVMMMEKTTASSKLNLDQAQLNEQIRSNKAREEAAKKPTKKEDVQLMAQRVSYDAEQALKGEVSGMVGVIITSPDKKEKKTSTGATDLGNEFVIKFDDGSTQRIPKTKQGIVNFIAQSDNLASGRDKGLVETAIREQGIPYDRPTVYGNIRASFLEGLQTIKKEKPWNDDKAARMIQTSLPPEWKVRNANNGLLNNQLEITSPNGESIIFDYTIKSSIQEAQNQLDRLEQNSSTANTNSQTVDPRAKYGMETTRNGKDYIFNTETGTYQLK